tara:strand:+ start:1483 stop:2196 length:714 start_codon:yes stop_codon:yes gene_type:complete
MMIALLEYQKAGTFDKMILISPSANEDPKYDMIDWSERHENYSPQLIEDIVQSQKDDIEDYKLYLEKLKVYEKFIRSKSLKNFTENEKRVLASMIILDEDGNELIEKPVNDYGREPYAIIVFDDLAGDNAYTNAIRNPLNSLACKQRHFRISSMHCVQTLKSLPRVIRQQCGIMAIFPTKDETALMDICKENCSSITPDEFMKFYHKATDDEKHSFLLADFNSGTFRKNYNELLHIR